MHQPELTELIKTGTPFLAAMFTKFTSWVSNERQTSKAIQEIAKQQLTLNERMNEFARLLAELQKGNMEIQERTAAAKPIGGQRRKAKKSDL